jgi:hypothetical protein
MSRPPDVRSLLSHGLILPASFLTRNNHFSRRSFLFVMGSPRYIKENVPRLRLNLFATICCSSRGCPNTITSLLWIVIIYR